jgi:predicted transcriptional regulator
MNKEDFETLLSDLYAIYNTSKGADIPGLLNKYNGQEFDAVKTLFIRYNFRGHPNYNSELGTDKHVRYLIERYSAQDRVLKKNGLVQPSAEETINKKITEASEKVQEETAKAKQETENFVSQKTEELDKYFATKKAEIELKLKNLEEAITKKVAELGEISKQAQPIIQQQEDKQKIELKLELNYDDEDLELPKEIKDMGPGARMLLYNSKQQPKGLEVKDVLYDCISEEGKCIKTMTIHRI